MTAQIRAGGAWKSISRHRVRVAGAWRDVVSRRIYADGEWRTVFTSASPLSLSLSTPTLTRTGAGSSLTTGNVTAIASGGTGPITYAWSLVNDDYPTVVANSPAFATTNFTASGLIVAEPANETWRCLATDSLGATAEAEVTLTFTRTG